MGVDVRLPSPPVADIFPHKTGKSLHEVPSASRVRPRECLLDESDGVDGQRKVGSNGKYLLVGGGATRVPRGGFLILPSRSHALILLTGEEEGVGVRRARINFFVPRPVTLLTRLRG